MSDAVVSVIMPAYKCARIIGRALDSLFAQTRVPDEVIVVDDGSPDDIATAVRPYGDRVRLIHKSNGGAASARNVGIDAAGGNLISFLDSDDAWEPTKLEKQLEVFRRHPEVGLVTSRYVLLTPAGEKEYYPELCGSRLDRVLHLQGAEAFELAMAVWTSVVTIRREAIGSDRFDVGLRTAEDRDLWVRIVSRVPMYVQSELLGTLYEGPGSLSRSDLDLDCRCMLKMINRYSPMLGGRGLRRWEASVYRRWAGTYLSQGRARAALRPALRRLRYEPLSAEGWWVAAKSASLAMIGAGTSVVAMSAEGGVI